MKNKLTDLNDHLFAQMERLAVETLDGAALDAEIRRAAAVVQVADTIVDNARVQLAAVKLADDLGINRNKMPQALLAPGPSAAVA